MFRTESLWRGARRMLFPVLAGLLAAGTFVTGNLADEKEAKKVPSAPKLGQFGGFPDWVSSVAFSPDGKTLAAGSYQVVRLCNPETKKVDHTLKTGKGFVRALAYSTDGKLLAVGGFRSLVLWDAVERKPAKTLEGHKGYVTGAAFSNDGKWLATSGEDEVIRLWAMPEGTPGPVLTGHGFPVQAVAFSPDSAVIASAAGDEDRVTKAGEVRLWNVATADLRAELPGHKKAATGVAFSPDGKWLVSTSVDEAVNVYDVQTGKALGFFGGHGRPTNAALFAPDSRMVISAAGGRAKGNNTVKLWLREDGDEKASMEDHEARVTCIALSPDAKTLASGSYDKSVILWNVASLLGAAKPTAAPTVEPAIAEIPEPVAAVERKQPVVAAQNAKAEAKQDDKAAVEVKELKAGIIGLDTSHATAFTNALNAAEKKADLAGCRIVAAYPKGSPDIESSTSRVPGYIEAVKKQGVEIVDSIPALLEKIDVVFLETNDGRPHLEQVLPVFKAKKPVFIDKPIAGTLADAIAIFELAKKYETPVFSSSSLRFTEGAQALRNGSAGDILGCEAYSPCSLEKTHPDLFWYGIHGVETLFTVMGTGCESVTRVSNPDSDYVTGSWSNGRIGTFRGIRKGTSGYGGTAYGTKGIVAVGSFGKDGPYRPLLVEVLKFFQSGVAPVDPKETLEIYAFMEAADESKRQGGKPVTLESVMTKAKAEAAKRIAEVDPSN